MTDADKALLRIIFCWQSEPMGRRCSLLQEAPADFGSLPESREKARLQGATHIPCPEVADDGNFQVLTYHNLLMERTHVIDGDVIDVGVFLHATINRLRAIDQPAELAGGDGCRDRPFLLEIADALWVLARLKRVSS